MTDSCSRCRCCVHALCARARVSPWTVTAPTANSSSKTTTWCPRTSTRPPATSPRPWSSWARPCMRRNSARIISPVSMCAARSRSCWRMRRRTCRTTSAPSTPRAWRRRSCWPNAAPSARSRSATRATRRSGRGPWARRTGVRPACVCVMPMAAPSTAFRHCACVCRCARHWPRPSSQVPRTAPTMCSR